MTLWFEASDAQSQTQTSSSLHSYEIVLLGAATASDAARLTQRVRCAPQINLQLFLNIDAGAIGYLRCEGVLLLTLRIKILYNSKFMQF